MRYPFLLLSLIPAIAHAEGEDIVVTGRALPDARGDAAYSSVTIDRARLTSVASGRAEDVLRDVAGLQQFRRSDSRSANATSQGVTLRGLGGNASSRALVLLDGVPQGDPFGGSVTFPALNLARIGAVQVTRGGGSGVAGPGAMAGTIALSSIGPESNGSSAAIAYGSRDAIEAGGVISGSLGSGFAFIAGDYARGDGFTPIIARQRGFADRPARYEQASLAARAVVPLGTTELQASLSGFTDRRDRGLAFTRNGSDGADASLRLVNDARWAWEALAYVQVRAFMSEASSVDAARTTSTQTLDQFNIPSTGIGARFEVRPPIAENIELRIGGDARRVSGTTREFFTFVAGVPTRGRIAGGESDTIGGFVESSATLGNLTLTGGGRIDFYTIRDGRLFENTLGTGATLRDDRFITRKASEPTARAGIAYALTPALTLRSAAYLGWRLPTLNELYRPFRIGADATAANAALKTERVRGVEAGIGWQPFEGAKLSTTFFTNRLEDAIANVTISRGPGTFPGVGFVTAAGVFRQRQNLDAIRSNGVELDATVILGDWRAQASYAYTDAIVRSSGIAASLNGLRPAQVARHNASATLGWKGISLTTRYVGPQFEDDQNLRRLRKAFTVDGSINLPLARGLAASFRAENITNSRIEAGVSATGVIERASPRMFWVGLRWADSR
jgi:outer membrane receptor protein involved in Fe transport